MSNTNLGRIVITDSRMDRSRSYHVNREVYVVPGRDITVSSQVLDGEVSPEVKTALEALESILGIDVIHLTKYEFRVFKGEAFDWGDDGEDDGEDSPGIHTLVIQALSGLWSSPPAVINQTSIPV
jgi:hypothetical protein